MQLRFKIALFVFIPTAVLVLLSMVVVQNTITRDLAEVRDRSFQANVTILSEPVIEAFLEQDFARLDEFFLNLRQSPDIKAGLTVDTDGLIISSDNPRLLGASFNPTDSGWYSHDLVVGGKARGTLWIQFDDTETASVISDVFMTGLLLLATTLIGLAGIAYWVGHRIGGRIGILASAANQIGNADYRARTDFKGSDELAQLGQVFDEMAEQIESSVVELSRSEQRTSLALAAGGMGIWVYDSKSNRVFADDRLAEIYGLANGGNAVGIDELLKHVHEDDLDHRSTLVDQTLVADSIVNREFRIRDASGQIRWINSQATALFAGANDARVIGIDQDITDAKKRYLEIESLKDELERSNSELDDFAHIASHDLKEPLRGISNYAQFLKEDYGDELDETATQYVDRMIALSKNLSDMIADLLRMSRITRLDHRDQTADFNSVLDEISQSLEFTLSERNAIIEVADDIPVVAMDPAGLRELLRNLIVNGIKYNESDQPTINVSYDPKSKAFCVADNGIGIAANQIDDVFSPFRHLNPHDRFGRSTGLGATICQKLVNNAGGKIWIESEVGSGSKFWFTLPLS